MGDDVVGTSVAPLGLGTKVHIPIPKCFQKSRAVAGCAIKMALGIIAPNHCFFRNVVEQSVVGKVAATDTAAAENGERKGRPQSNANEIKSESSYHAEKMRSMFL